MSVTLPEPSDYEGLPLTTRVYEADSSVGVLPGFMSYDG
jgi:hypothetical protein